MMTNIKVNLLKNQGDSKNGANNFSNEGDLKSKMTDKIKITTKSRWISEMKMA